MTASTVSYNDLYNALDAWAAYHGRFSDTARTLFACIPDAWGRLPEQWAARAAAKRVRDFHGGHPENCARATRLVELLESI